MNMISKLKETENTALIEALMDMVNQHCCRPNGYCYPLGLSANESAIDLLEELGFAEPHKSGKGYVLLWDKLKEHKNNESVLSTKFKPNI